MTVSGSCLCGGVRFELERAVGPFEICHCNRCRKASGSATMHALGVRTEDFRLVCGAELIRTYAAPMLYEPPAYTVSFCGRCGSPVPPARPKGDWFEIPAGLLDGDPEIRPDKHIFVEFLPPWDDISDTLPRLTAPQLIEAREGRPVAPNFRLRTHHDEPDTP